MPAVLPVSMNHSTPSATQRYTDLTVQGSRITLAKRILQLNSCKMDAAGQRAWGMEHRRPACVIPGFGFIPTRPACGILRSRLKLRAFPRPFSAIPLKNQHAGSRHPASAESQKVLNPRQTGRKKSIGGKKLNNGGTPFLFSGAGKGFSDAPIFQLFTPISFGGTPILSVGTSILFLGAVRLFSGAPILFVGTPISFVGTPISFGGTPISFGGAPIFQLFSPNSFSQGATHRQPTSEATI